MIKKSLLSSAILASFVAPSFADDAVYVVRPPVMQMRANVLPPNAFKATQAPATPSQPSTPAQPPQSQYIFESPYFSDQTSPWNVSVSKATVKIGETYQIPRPKTGACDVGDSYPAKTVGNYLETFGYTGIISPKVPGKFALTISCDGVANAPNGLYFGKIIITATP